MNWAIVIPAGIGIAVLLSIALVAIDVSGQISRQEEADEVEFYFAKGFAQTTPSSHIPPYQDVSKTVYGYEYQGDNLLLARVNLFLTFTENWIEKLGLPISASWAIAVATRISWNIWQMDGLKDTAPGTDTLCLIYDWEKNEEVTFRQIKEESDNV